MLQCWDRDLGHHVIPHRHHLLFFFIQETAKTVKQENRGLVICGYLQKRAELPTQLPARPETTLSGSGISEITSLSYQCTLCSHSSGVLMFSNFCPSALDCVTTMNIIAAETFTEWHGSSLSKENIWVFRPTTTVQQQFNLNTYQNICHSLWFKTNSQLICCNSRQRRRKRANHTHGYTTPKPGMCCICKQDMLTNHRGRLKKARKLVYNLQHLRRHFHGLNITPEFIHMVLWWKIITYCLGNTAMEIKWRKKPAF